MNLPFEKALVLIKQGAKVTDDEGVNPNHNGYTENLFMQDGIIMAETIRYKRWTPSQREILSEKWREVKK